MKKFLTKIEPPKWVLVLCFFTLILRIPSFFEPFSYGDEMIYLTLGEGIRQGLVLYKDIHDNKPPLLYLLAAIAGNIFWFKVILATWNIVTICFFWKLVSHLFKKNKRIQKFATWAFALLTTLPLLEGNIANAELFFMGPIIAAFWILLAKPNRTKNLLLSGALFAIAALFKIPAAFDLPAIIIFWLITQKPSKENLVKIAKNFALILVGFSVPILITFVYYWLRGALSEYWVAAFMQNVGYLSSFRPTDVQKPFFERNFPLLVRAIAVLVGSGIIYIFRKKLSKEFIFTVLWLLFSLFAVTLSERPYPHYLLQSAASISILIGLLVAARNIEQVLVIFPLTLTALVPVYYKFYHYDTRVYYQRFIEFALGRQTKEEYFNGFDQNTRRNYEIAEFLSLSSKPREKVFVWGDSSTVYALSRRLPPIKYVANYHIKDFSSPEEVLKTLNQNPPGFIVIMPDAGTPLALRKFVGEKYFLIETIEGAEIWRLMDAKVKK